VKISGMEKSNQRRLLWAKQKIF